MFRVSILGIRFTVKALGILYLEFVLQFGFPVLFKSLKGTNTFPCFHGFNWNWHLSLFSFMSSPGTLKGPDTQTGVPRPQQYSECRKIRILGPLR